MHGNSKTCTFLAAKWGSTYTQVRLIHRKIRYIRKQFIAKQSQILNLTSFDDYKKLCYILFTTSNKTSIHCTAKYISKCLLLRDK